jgi:tetratricopeptide (TPR) repeat protein
MVLLLFAFSARWPNLARAGGASLARMRCARDNLVAGDFYMRVMARVLFSIAILTMATPALARGERDDDQRLTAEILNPKLAVFYYYRATVHYYMDRYDDAITDYDLAIRLRRNYADAYYNRGLAYEGRGLLRQALGDLRKALACNAFALPASSWTNEARAKISEIETKLSATANLQAQTTAADAGDTVVK